MRRILALLLLCCALQVQAQDLEPRRWSHLPVGLNVLGLAGGWTGGDIFLDPVLLAGSRRFPAYELRRIKAIIDARGEEFLEAWHGWFGG